MKVLKQLAGWIEIRVRHLEVFFKKVFHKIHRKIPALESLFNIVAAWKTCNFIKKKLRQSCFPMNFAEFFKNIYFEEHLRTDSCVKWSSEKIYSREHIHMKTPVMASFLQFY